MGPFLTWVIKILIYAVCGAVAGALMGNKKGGLLRNIIVGFLGAVLGGFLAASDSGSRKLDRFHHYFYRRSMPRTVALQEAILNAGH